jgi:CYTH domain-containing protein
VRPEFEYEVPVEEAEAMFRLCHRPLIEKTRYEVSHADLVWQVDEFHGGNAGLILAEVELDHPEQPVECPPWLGQEVSQDPRFRNSRLSDQPQGARSSEEADWASNLVTSNTIQREAIHWDGIVDRS